MIRLILLTLATSPMLFPAGVCVCRFLPAGPDETRTELCCSDGGDCCSSHQDEESKGPPSSPFNCPLDQGGLCAGPSILAVKTERQDRTDSILAKLPVMEAFVVTDVGAGERRCNVQFRPPKPPLYLSLCALLI